MLGSRATLQDLSELSRRVATSTQAGVDSRTIWSGEARRARGPLKAALQTIATSLSRGDSLPEALTQTGDTFPADYHELIAVADQTGALPEILRSLSAHYDRLIAFRKEFIQQISWPMIQLGMSLGIIGAFIYILGFLAPGMDPLGFGLVGTSGLITYIFIVGSIILALGLIYRAVTSGALWIKPAQYVVLRIPILGRALNTLALGQFASILALTTSAGVEIRRAVGLALRSTQFAPYVDLQSFLHNHISQGSPLHEGLRQCSVFPDNFVDIVEVGEDTGNLPEQLHRTAENYRQDAYAAIRSLTQLAAFFVWAAIATLIAFCIFKIFHGLIMKPIEDVQNGNF